MRISDWSSDVCSSDLVGTVMDGDAEEHIAEVAKVLSRYVDMIGVRAFPKFVDWSLDRQDRVLQGFAKHATVQIGRASCRERVCQYVQFSVVAVSLKKKESN